MTRPRPTAHGPFKASDVPEGSYYELSDGHPVECAPAGSRGSARTGQGFEIVDTDPLVDEAGVDTGYAPAERTLRAPDVAVGNVPDAPGWVKGVPPLAIEYADRGQDETQLAEKIVELLGAGTRAVWVVRLVGPRRVEVHEADKPMRIAYPGEVLEAAGILRNAVEVEALFDRERAHEAVLRNLLQRRGYESLEAVRNEGVAEGKAEGKVEGKIEGRIEGQIEGRVEGVRRAIVRVLEARGLAMTAAMVERIEACRDLDRLERWLAKAATALSVDQVFGDDT